MNTIPAQITIAATTADKDVRQVLQDLLQDIAWASAAHPEPELEWLMPCASLIEGDFMQGFYFYHYMQFAPEGTFLEILKRLDQSPYVVGVMMASGRSDTDLGHHLLYSHKTTVAHAAQMRKRYLAGLTRMLVTPVCTTHIIDIPTPEVSNEQQEDA